MVFLENWSFFQVFFLDNIGQENVFYDILERKNAFSFRTKKRISRQKKQSRKIDIFPKGLTHGFAQKFFIFLCFFLGNIGQENVFYDILERKNAFLGYKNKKFKKLKNWHFSKGVNPWFWWKAGHFSMFLFRQ